MTFSSALFPTRAPTFLAASIFDPFSNFISLSIVEALASVTPCSSSIICA
jgi:hypothetical protein